MSRCLIIAAYNPYGIKNSIELRSDDFIICADGGYDLAKADGIIPDVLIGDLDSVYSDVSQCKEIIRVAPEKDDTDLMLCLKYAFTKSFNEYVIVGGIGGRLEHTLGNIQALSYACDFTDKISMVDSEYICTVISHGSFVISSKSDKKYFSLLSLSDKCVGVSITGAKYTLRDETVTNKFPIGISNEFLSDDVTISLESGMLLIIQ